VRMGLRAAQASLVSAELPNASVGVARITADTLDEGGIRKRVAGVDGMAVQLPTLEDAWTRATAARVWWTRCAGCW
jgi:hypothetical protein